MLHGPRPGPGGARLQEEELLRHLNWILIPVFFVLVLVSHSFASRLKEEAGGEGLKRGGSVTEGGFIRHGEYSLYLPGPTALRVGSLGNTSLAADYVWLKSVQYVSKEFGEREKWQKFEWLKRMYETMLELDPKWVQAIRLGGLLLGASGRDVDEATSILVQGMFENPDSWVLPYEVGVAYLFHPDRARETANFLEIAASRKDCPEAVRARIRGILPGLNSMAGRLEKAMEQAWRLWQEHKGTPLEEVYRRQWVQSAARFVENLLTEAAKDFELRTGRYPSRIEELVEARIIRKVPPEPFGLRWHVNAETGRVRSEGLVNLFAYRAIHAFNEASRFFSQTKGRKPGSLEEVLKFGRLLLQAGRLPADWGDYFKSAGADPLGRPYEFDAEKSEVVLPEDYTPERFFSRSLIEPREGIESPRDL